MHDEDRGLCCKAWGYLHHRLGHGGKLGLTLRFSSVQDGIYVLRKAHMHSTPALRSFPNIGA